MGDSGNHLNMLGRPDDKSRRPVIKIHLALFGVIGKPMKPAKSERITSQIILAASAMRNPR
jgi:hypothetical protein